MKYELDLMDARSEGQVEGTIQTLQRLGYSQEQIITEVEKTYGVSKAKTMDLLNRLSK